ncbi:MAG: DNA/RNA non-specific endonuclease, partial [Verrucomicrobiota bacterium]
MFFLLTLGCGLAPLRARLGIEYQTGLGRPTDAAADATRRTDYLIPRSQFVISYNDDTRQANWVGWSLSNADRGLTDRTDAWSVETMLPSGYLRVGTATFGTGWDRGHMSPSADRTLTYADNAATFVMSNIVPQASRNNQGLWGDFEDYCRTLSNDGSEIVIVSGPGQFGGSMLSNGMAIPGSVWKIAVKVPAGNGTAAQRVNTSTRVIALLTPNINDPNLGSWQGYITSVEEIEAVTGFEFFRDIKALNPALATYLKNVVDTGTGPNAPTVITSFSPNSGAPGTPVTISGYHFGTAPQVRFNGVAATATVIGNGSQIATTVPSGAATGEITVVSTNGTDSSGAAFTVWSSNGPSIALSTLSLSGLTATEGGPGLSKTYTVSAANLSEPVTLSASSGFEVSLDNAAFAPSVLLPASGGSMMNVPVYVRVSANAPVGILSGEIVHSSSGAQQVATSLSGEVFSNQPTLNVSTSALSGFNAVLGVGGTPKAYAISGYNLGGAVLVQAPENFEVALAGGAYASSISILPANGTMPVTVVNVRLTATAPPAPVSGNVTHSGGGASPKLLAVSGQAGAAETGENAQAVWNFDSLAPVITPQVTTFGVGELTRGNNFASSNSILSPDSPSTNSGASGGNNSCAAARGGSLSTGGNGSAYFEFAVTPGAGVGFALKEFVFTTRSSATGPTAYALRSSADGFATNILEGLTSNNSVWSLKSHTGLSFQSNATTTFRLFGFNGTATSAGSTNWRIDDLKLNIATTVPSKSPVVTSPSVASATAFDFFSYQITADNAPDGFSAAGLPDGLTCNSTTGLISGTPTVPGSYVVAISASNPSGDGSASLAITVSTNPNAPAITGNLSAIGSLRAPFDFTVAATNSPKAFLATGLPAGLSMNPATGQISGTPETAGVFNVPLTVQGDFGSDSKTLHLVVTDPTLTLSTNSLAGFTANLSSAGAASTYSLSGSELSGPTTVLAPQGFEISSDGVVFSETLTLNPSSGSLSTNLSVRLSANATLGAQSGSVIHSGGGAVPKYLAVSGNVTSPQPILNLSTTSLEPFSTTTNKTSIFQTYTIAGSGLSGNVSIQAPAGFELRREGGADFSNSLQLAPANGALAQTTIEVRLAARATAGTFSGSISHTASGVTVKTVAVSGTVTSVVPPVISTSGSGSAYRGKSHSLQIRLEGSTPVSGYGATGLPSGMTINTATGLISGTPASSGNYSLSLSATGSGGTATANYTLVVREQNADLSNPLDLLVNKFSNDGTNDVVELLVAARGVPGGTADLRGIVLKDFSSNMGSDLGGKYIFSNSTLWQAVKAGTLIVLSSTNATEDLDASDFVLRANLGNANLFSVALGGFDIASTDMVLVKMAGTGADGFAGGMHALSAGSPGSQYSNFNGRKLNTSRTTSSSRPIAYALNTSSSLADFYSSSGADTARTLTFGSGNNAKNTTFIASLRTTANNPPVITLNGANPMTIAHGTVYAEPGATANDLEDGNRTVTISGAVNSNVVGTYTVTYRTSDTGNLTTTVDRIV